MVEDKTEHLFNTKNDLVLTRYANDVLGEVNNKWHLDLNELILSRSQLSYEVHCRFSTVLKRMAQLESADEEVNKPNHKRKSCPVRKKRVAKTVKMAESDSDS